MIHPFTVRSLLLVLLACATSVTQVVAQRQGRLEGQPLSGQITGQVRFANGGQPASEVLVSCDSFSGGMVDQIRTDRSGRFKFQNLGPAQFTVSVRHPGFLPVSQTVELMTTSSAYVQLTLTPDPFVTKPSTTGVVDSSIPLEAQKEFDKAEEAIAKGKKEDLQVAVRHYLESLRIYPKFVQAQLKLGTAYMDLGQWDEAEAALKKTIEMNPKAANAYLALGEVYLRQKKNAEAEKVLLQGLELDPQSHSGHLILARVYWDNATKLKDETASRPFLEKAYAQVTESLRLDPSVAEGHLLRGNILLRARRALDAQHEYEEYLRLDPKGPFAEQTRATVEKIKKALSQSKSQE